MDYSELQNKTKENIIKISFNLFADYGIHNVALVQIAKESNIGVATIYRYFGNKKKIISECANYIWNKITIITNDKINSNQFKALSGINKIKSLLEIYLDLYKNNTQYLKFISEFDSYIAKEVLSKEEELLYSKNFSKFHNITLTFFQEGIEDKTIKSNIDFDILYYSTTRALLEVGMKGANAPLLIENDQKISIEKQLNQLITMTIYYCIKGD